MFVLSTKWQPFQMQRAIVSHVETFMVLPPLLHVNIMYSHMWYDVVPTKTCPPSLPLSYWLIRNFNWRNIPKKRWNISVGFVRFSSEIWTNIAWLLVGRLHLHLRSMKCGVISINIVVVKSRRSIDRSVVVARMLVADPVGWDEKWVGWWSGSVSS